MSFNDSMKKFLSLLEIPSDAIILDARTDLQFSSGHIPGARHAEFVSQKFMIRDAAGLEEFHGVLQSWIQSIGLELGNKVLVYDSGFDSRAARTAWALEYAGLDVGLLIGGFKAWEAASQAISNEITSHTSSNFKLEPHRELLATAEDILNRSENTIVLDARDSLEFSGQKIPAGATRGGHIPGAEHYEWTKVMNQNGYQNNSELEQSLPSFAKNAEIIVHCQSGARSAVLFHALESQGYKVKNYLGSMNEWLTNLDLPIE
jgi:thiosulfate/3-mercaptopyruvate sulfurtransferase